MRSIICILLFVVVAMANNKPQYDLSDAPYLFKKIIKDYNRNYKDDVDEMVHYKAFLDSLVTINEANAEQPSATFDINNFADYTSEEMENMHGFNLENEDEGDEDKGDEDKGDEDKRDEDKGDEDEGDEDENYEE